MNKKVSNLKSLLFCNCPIMSIKLVLNVVCREYDLSSNCTFSTLFLTVMLTVISLRFPPPHVGFSPKFATVKYVKMTFSFGWGMYELAPERVYQHSFIVNTPWYFLHNQNSNEYLFHWKQNWCTQLKSIRYPTYTYSVKRSKIGINNFLQ